MQDRAHLTQSGEKGKTKTWSVQLVVPRDLRKKVGKTKLIRSLKTHDLRKAREDRDEVLAEWRAMLQAMRQPAPTTATGSAADGTGVVLVDGLPVAQDLTGLDWQARARHWRSTPPDPLTDHVIADEADDVERQHGPEAAADFAGVAYGTHTPLAEHFDTWIAEAKLSAKTEKQYRADFGRFRQWAKQKRITTVQGVTKAIASDFRNSLTGAWSTKNRTLSPLMSYWKWLMDRGYVETSPWLRQSFKKQDQTRRGFTDEEMAQIVAGATGELHDAIMFSALAGGVRFGAVSNLRVRDVDLDAGWVRIVKDKTKAGARRIPIHPNLKPILERRTAGQQPDARVFPQAKLSERFTALRQGLGIEEKATPNQRQSDVVGHSIRHWATTVMRNRGADTLTVDILTGHKPEGETDGRYHDAAKGIINGELEAKLRAAIQSLRLP